MRREQLESLHRWFEDYVEGFYHDPGTSQAGIRIKDAHTRRVCANMVRIGNSLGLGDEDLAMAEAIALLHDVGRFRQFSRHRTFSDRRSENHAQLGLEELDRAGVLSVLEKGDRDIIARAVGCHNLLDLPKDLQGRPLLFVQLIRDADKLDILGVFSGHYDRPDSDLTQVLGAEATASGDYSRSLAAKILRREKCSYDEIKGPHDRKLLLLSWIYDINFAATLSEISSASYLEGILATLPESGEIKEIYQHLTAYVSGRLA